MLPLSIIVFFKVEFSSVEGMSEGAVARRASRAYSWECRSAEDVMYIKERRNRMIEYYH
jgi:hypothetical protein